MSKLVSPRLCTGCTACASICPTQCISMVADKDGFLYPEINSDLCVDCSLCNAVCPILHKQELSHSPKAYAVINKDNVIREQSSSGGVFYLLAEYVIEHGGVVFGAKFDKDFTVVHSYAETTGDVKSFMGSKYVQSKMSTSYQKAKEFLESGRLVLFTGTPCQIGGLKSFLGKDYDNLICQDIICHGVPSPAIWKKYVSYREAQAKSKTQNISFRQKSHGWHNYSMHFEFSSHSEYQCFHGTDPYMCSFLQDLDLRPSCYNCHFKKLARDADITLADFWGIERVAPQMDDNGGTSLIITHSLKGQKLFEEIRHRTTWKQVNLEEAIAGNISMIQSVHEKPARASFLKEMQTGDFKRVVKKYCIEGFFSKIKRKLKSWLRKIIS